MSSGIINNTYIHCSDDAFYMNSNIVYDPSSWKSEIEIGKGLFLDNIFPKININDKDNADIIDRIFPERTLTESEVSVAYRHLYALKCISESKSLGIILKMMCILSRGKKQYR